MINIILVGACGKMGKTIARLIIDSDEFKLVWAKEKEGHQNIGKDIGELVAAKQIGVAVYDRFPEELLRGVVIDFSSPDATFEALQFAYERELPFLSGTTGLSQKDFQKMKEYSSKIPILYGSNMSIGMNLIFILLRKMARLIGDKADIEIIEYHHREKPDSPSGTAMKLAEIIANSLGLVLNDVAKFGRYGKESKRKQNEIGIHAVRGGNFIGKHEIIFSLPYENIIIAHDVLSREVFARGALKCAKFLSNATEGFYSPEDLFRIEKI